MRQNLILATVIVVGGVVYLQAADRAIAADGLRSTTLVFGGHAVTAVLSIVAATIPVVVLGGLAAATGHPLSGIFTVAAALGFVAISGGSIEPWLYQFGTPEAYRRLILEDLFWGVLIAAALLTTARLHGLIGRWLPRWLRADRGTAATVEPADPAAELLWLPPPNEWHPSKEHGAHPSAGAGETPSDDASDTRAEPLTRAWAAGATSVVVGAVFGSLLLQTAAAGQVFGGLVLAFLLAGGIAHQILPTRRALPILLSPIVVGILGHAWVATTYAGQGAILASHFSGELPHLALALPSYYASAGVAGAAMGLGWSHSVLLARHTAEAP